VSAMHLAGALVALALLGFLLFALLRPERLS
jgi:K+-transporting ATPase KdpF subunit